MVYQTSGHGFAVGGTGSRRLGTKVSDYAPRLNSRISKRSFLVHKHNKFYTIPIEQIAYFYTKDLTPVIVTFEGQEYVVSNSLDYLQELLSGKGFFRFNRQYLICLNAIREVEHTPDQKLQVTLAVPTREKLVVTGEKANRFMQWFKNR